jgi:hypothetical protein
MFQRDTLDIASNIRNLKVDFPLVSGTDQPTQTKKKGGLFPE